MGVVSAWLTAGSSSWFTKGKVISCRHPAAYTQQYTMLMHSIVRFRNCNTFVVYYTLGWYILIYTNAHTTTYIKNIYFKKNHLISHRLYLMEPLKFIPIFGLQEQQFLNN